MKTKEQIFEEVVTPNGGGTLREKVYQAMQLYSDQQNKELRDELSKMKAMFDFDKTRAEITRLTKENKELEEKLMSEQIENGYLQAFKVSNESEIQRLTRELNDSKYAHGFAEVEIKSLTNRYNTCAENFAALQVRFGEEAAKVTRLRELLGMAKDVSGQSLNTLEGIYNNAMQFYEEGDKPSWAVSAEQAIKELKQLLTEIDNALNHKP